MKGRAPAAGLAAIEAAAARHHLAVMGAFHPRPGDGLPEGSGTLVMLGPREPGFWSHVTAEPEWHDDRPDPLDRWSRRVIGGIACTFAAKARFPFTGPPYHPFYAWALRSGRAWVSPVTVLVHDEMGLFASWRGALVLRERLELPETPAGPPCDSCADRPCLGACPAKALGEAGYDVPACRSWLATRQGQDCLASGCAVRRACPVSRRYGRLAEQSAYHMGQFNR